MNIALSKDPVRSRTRTDGLDEFRLESGAASIPQKWRKLMRGA